MSNVRASVRRIYGFSGHADRQGLIDWSGNFKDAPKQVFLTHGDEDAAESLAAELRKTRNWNVAIPHYESVHDIE
jgi:metallo-beta-lactamase family protein